MMVGGCDSGNINENNPYTGPEWPAAFMPNVDPFTETYSWQGTNRLVFYKQYDGFSDVDGWAPPSLEIGIGRYNLISIVENSKIVVADYTYGTESDFCTSYEVTSNSLTFFSGMFDDTGSTFTR